MRGIGRRGGDAIARKAGMGARRAAIGGVDGDGLGSRAGVEGAAINGVGGDALGWTARAPGYHSSSSSLTSSYTRFFA